MTFERLGDFLKNDSSNDSLRRVYLAAQLQKDIEKLTPDPLRVILRKGQITIRCVSSAQGKYLTLNFNKVMAIVAKHGLQSNKVKITLGY